MAASDDRSLEVITPEQSEEIWLDRVESIACHDFRLDVTHYLNDNYCPLTLELNDAG